MILARKITTIEPAHRHCLNPIIITYPQLIQRITTPSIEKIHNTVIAAANYNTALLCEGHLTCPA